MSSQGVSIQENVTEIFQKSLHTRFPSVYPRPPQFIDLLKELCKHNEVTDKWEQIGVFLGINVELIKINYHGESPKSCFEQILMEWMKQSDPPPSWSTIISAIESCTDNYSLAQKLRIKYLVPQNLKSTNEVSIQQPTVVVPSLPVWHQSFTRKGTNLVACI